MYTLLKLLLPKKIYDSLVRFYVKNFLIKKEYTLLRHKTVTCRHVEDILSAQFKREMPPRIAILTDQLDIITKFSKNYSVINCHGGKDLVSNISSYYFFIYACENSDNGIPYIQQIIKEKKKFIPVFVGSATPARYLEEDCIAKNVLLDLHTLQNKEGFAKFVYGPGADLINICQMIERTKHLPGAYVEIGCYRGCSGQIAVKFMRDKNIFRKSVFIDVFDGFNYEEARQSSDAVWLNTHKTEGIDIIRNRLERFALSEKGLVVDVRKNNIISDDCLDDIDEIAVANIDVDIYEAVVASLKKVFPKLVRGGGMIIEDPGHHPILIGARVALEEFLASLSFDEYILVQMESGQFIVFKIR